MCPGGDSNRKPLECESRQTPLCQPARGQKTKNTLGERLVRVLLAWGKWLYVATTRANSSVQRCNFLLQVTGVRIA
jgi:hypothetical protein